MVSEDKYMQHTLSGTLEINKTDCFCSGDLCLLFVQVSVNLLLRLSV